MMKTIEEISLSREAIAKAVELWKGLLASPKYDNMGNTGTAEERNTMGLASVMAHLIPKNNTPERLDDFGEALSRILATKTIHPDGDYWIGVDYGPCGDLADAANEVSLKMEWPWKTNMWIRKDSVRLRAGYAAPMQTYAVDYSRKDDDEND